MTLETFFEKFDQFADAPDAVAKMRELILQLAAGGRLVSQSPDDQPADALAVTISEDRATFVKARSLARQRVFDPVADDQWPFDLPSGWLWTRLGNLCRVQAGFAFQSAAFVQGDSGVPMIRIRDITKDRTQVNYVGEYRNEFLVEAGDYLVGMDGNFTVAKWRGPRALLNQRISRLQWYSQHLEPSFFAIALQYRLSELQGTKAYTTVDHLSSGQIENAVVPLPPLAEQKRIVAKVDELMALCDRLEAQQQEGETRHAALARASLARFADAPTPANLQFLFHPSYTIPPADLRKSILTLAVQGKLVPQDPNDEPADVLLARLTHREPTNNKARRKSEPMQAFTPDEIPFELPCGWAWERLGNIGETNIGLTYSPQDVSDAGIPVLRASNIQNGKLDFEDLVRVKCEPKQSVMVQDGDLLICVRSGSRGLVGKVAVIERLKEPAAFGAFMAIFRSEVNQYLYQFIRSPLFRQMIDEVNTTTINQITQNNLRSTLAPIPPLAEQRRIVAKVDQLMTLVDQLETQLAASRVTGAKLVDAIVSELAAAA